MKQDFLNLISSDSPISFSYWNELLNYFKEHKEELNLKELKIIVDRCEECRLYLNVNNTDPIERSDTNPNIYEYLDKKIKDNKNKEEWTPDYQEQHALSV